MERTESILRMSATLDVSKLSGWLNAYASCRVDRRAFDARRGGGPGGGRAWGRGSASSAQRDGLTKAWGGRVGAERTTNMLFMYVTLDVSKLSGWLNAHAPCRVERRAHAMRDEVRAAGGGRAWGGGGACARGGTDCEGWGGQGTRGERT